jgi:hypothetical protein
MMLDYLQAVAGAWAFFAVTGIVFIGNLYGNRWMKSGGVSVFFAERNTNEPLAPWKRMAIRLHFCFVVLFGVAAGLIGIFAVFVSVLTLLTLAGIVQ